jgi:hypothetical protein
MVKPTRAVAKPQLRGWPGKSLHLQWDDDDSEPKRAPDVPQPAPHPVTFECRTIPALGLGLPSGMRCFQYGRLTLTDARDIEAIRKHGWFGRQIRVLTEAETAQDPRTEEAEARWQAREEEKKAIAEEQRRSHLMGPRGPLIEWVQRRRR